MARREISELTENHRPRFVGIASLAAHFEISKETVKKWQQRDWLEGVHYVKMSRGRSGGVRYNLPMCEHWLATRHDPALHEKFCQEYLSGLQNPGKLRKAS